MFEINEENFPLVRVNFIKTIENDEEFNLFINKWLSYYTEKKQFKFIFDTTKITELPNIKYCFQMALFIKKLKKYDYQYLDESIILINNPKIQWLLDFIFVLQPPVANVYIYKFKDENINQIIDNNTLSTIKNNTITKLIEPGKSFLPFL